LLVVGLGWGVYLVLGALLRQLAGVTTDVGKAIVTAGATVFAAVLSVVLGKLWEQRVKINEEVRQRKLPVYEQQIALMFSFLSKDEASKPTQQDVQKAFRSITEKLLVWGGPAAIRAWSAFRLHTWEKDRPREGFLKFEAFIKAVRKELGNTNTPLADGDLLRTFINDIDVSALTRGHTTDEPGGGS
jgi:hypothetical protein